MRPLRSILLTGGAGFVGSALARHLLQDDSVERLVVLDKLGERGDPGNLIGPDHDRRFTFVHGDVLDRPLVTKLLREHQVTGAFHLAAASRADQSVENADEFISTNILGTASVLHCCRREAVPLLLSSTDEVYGSIDPPHRAMEKDPLNPTSPYAASKASTDLLALAAAKSHAQDVVITRCSQNYGPRQHREEFIPRLVTAAFHDQPLILEGDGMQIRDWIHVDDHCRGMIAAFEKGTAGAVYLLGGNCERTNLGVARSILDVFGKPHTLISRAADHPGNDRRSSVDPGKAFAALDWRPKERFGTAFPLVVRELAANMHNARIQ